MMETLRPLPVMGKAIPIAYLLAKQQTYPEMYWAPVIQETKLIPLELAAVVYTKSINWFCIICMGLVQCPGNWNKDEQNPEYDQGADERSL